MTRDDLEAKLKEQVAVIETWLDNPACDGKARPFYEGERSALCGVLKHLGTLSSPCACIDAQEVEDWIAGLSTMDDAGDRAAQANALIKELHNRKPCACEGEKPLAVVHGGIRKDDLDDVPNYIIDQLLYRREVDNLRSHGEECCWLRVLVFANEP